MSFFDKKIAPPRQAFWMFCLSAAAMLGGFALKKMGVFNLDRLYEWTVATSFLLLFGIFNSVFSLNADSRLTYWRDSMYSYLGLAAANGLLAWQLSGIKIGEAGSYKFIYLVVTVGFLVFISMVNAMRSIVEFAQKEEWNQPRRK